MSSNPIPIKAVLDLCGVSYRGGRSNEYIPCPICDSGRNDSRHRHLNVNFDKDVFRCPKCDTGGGSVALFAFIAKGIHPESLANKATFASIASELTEKAGLGGTVETFTYQPSYEEKPKDFPPTDIESRDEAYQAMFDKLELADDHYNNLVKRGLRESDIVAGGYVSTPIIGIKKIPSELRQEGIQLAGVPGFYKKNNVWTMIQMGRGIYIPVRDLSGILARGKGYIQGIQNRLDNPPHGNKYMWLSSRDYESGCGAETWCHFAGYPEEEVLLTEGPLKADVIHRFLDQPVIAVPGVNALGHLDEFFDSLYKLGVKKIDTAFDMDFKTNPHVKKGYDKLISKIQEYGFSYEMMSWDDKYKGLDDYLLARYLAKGGKLDPLK